MKKKSLFLSLITLLSLTGCVKYNGLPQEEAECEHTYSEVYSYDGINHWRAATCEHTDLKKDYSEHTYGDYIVSQEATLTADGMKVRTCSVCGYKDEAIITKLSQTNPDDTNATGTITGINVDRESIEMSIGDNPISLTARIVGEGTLPSSLTVTCDDMPVKKVVDGEEITENVKVASISSTVVESGTAFTVSALAEGTTKITIYSPAKPEIKKEVEVKVNAKVTSHSVEINEHSVEMYKGSQRVLTCKSTDNVTWSTSDSSVVSLENLTNSGVWLKGVKKSDTPVTITATICAGTPDEHSDSCEVTVTANEQLVFNYYYINNQKLTDVHLFMWDDNHNNNAEWPGVDLGSASYLNKEYNEVYQITVDKGDFDYKNIIISGNDSNGEFVQTVDISLSSFSVQNAFNIPTLPSDVLEGTRKAGIKLCSFNSSTDILEDSDYVTLSMNTASMIAGNSLNINTYSSSDEVDYEITTGEDIVSISTTSKDGFTINAIKGGEATITATINKGSDPKTATLTVNVVEDELLTYYFTNNYLWTDLKVFMWNDATGRHNATFPGVELTNKVFTDEDGKDVYAIQCYKIADNWQGFIISGKDEYRDGTCQTVNINFVDFGDHNNVKMNEWKEGETNVANVKFSDVSNKLFLSVDAVSTIRAGSTVYISVNTNAEEVTYSPRSGKDHIQITDESTKGAKVKGVSAGTSSIEISVGEGDEKITKIVPIKVVNDEIISVYFLNEYEWTNVCVYLYVDDNNKNANWPGVPMTLVDHDNRNKEIYAVSFSKFADGYTHIIFNGDDVVKEGKAQTVTIDVSNIDEEKNCYYVTGWKDETRLEASVSTIKMGDYLNIDKNSKTLKVGDTWNLNFNSNKEVSFENTDGEVIEINKENGYFAITALKEGTSVLTAFIGTGTDRIEKCCTITVTNDEPEPEEYTYTITNVDSYYPNDGALIYAYIWGGDVQGNEWVECSYNNGTVTFESTYENIVNVIVVRINPSGSIDWPSVWNQSEDLTFNNRTVVFVDKK